MAKDAVDGGSESAVDNNDSAGQTSRAADEFERLIAWAKDEEDKNESLRIHQLVMTIDPPEPSVRLRYSHPLIEVGLVAGYKKGDGGFFAMPN